MRKLRYGLIFLLLGLVVLLLILLNIGAGTVSVSPSEIIRVLEGEGTSLTHKIVVEMRTPRALGAALIGAALGLSGYLLQTFFQNPIAGPFILGISSGARLAVAAVMIITLRQLPRLNSLTLVVAAFVGALLAMLIVLALASFVSQMSILIVCGVMIGYICSAITELLITFADDQNIVKLHNWGRGSFASLTWDNVIVLAEIVLPCAVLTMLLAKSMAAYALGEAYALNLGLRLRLFRLSLILLASLLAAAVAAFAGPISFVGIAVPHLVKQLFRTSRPLVIIPGVMLGGAIFCLFCDLPARLLFAPTELGISTVTAVFGAPIVLYIMLSRRRRKGEYHV